MKVWGFEAASVEGVRIQGLRFVFWGFRGLVKKLPYAMGFWLTDEETGEAR